MMQQGKGRSRRLFASHVLLLIWTATLFAAPPSPRLDSPAEGNWAVSVGEVAPPFELKDVNGKVWTLAQFAGKPVVLFFWGSW